MKTVIDRTNGYPLALSPTSTYRWGLFVPTDGIRSNWAHNFFFRTRKDAITHGRKTFRYFAVGRVQS